MPWCCTESESALPGFWVWYYSALPPMCRRMTLFTISDSAPPSASPLLRSRYRHRFALRRTSCLCGGIPSALSHCRLRANPSANAPDNNVYMYVTWRRAPLRRMSPRLHRRSSTSAGLCRCWLCSASGKNRRAPRVCPGRGRCLTSLTSAELVLRGPQSRPLASERTRASSLPLWPMWVRPVW